MHSPHVYLIFWFPTGAKSSANYASLLNRYLTDFSSSYMANILTQYSDQTEPATRTITFGGAWRDTTTFPHAGTASDPILDSDLRNSIGRARSANPSWAGASTDTLFVVTTPRGIRECETTAKDSCAFSGGSHSNFCGYHFSYSSGTGTVVYAYIPDNGTDLAACGTPNGDAPNGNEEADATVSTMSHEVYEAITNPRVNVNDAWAGGNGGYEIGDKCRFDYPNISADGSNVTFNGHEYIVQSEFSNAALSCKLNYGGAPDPHAVRPGFNSFDIPSNDDGFLGPIYMRGIQLQVAGVTYDSLYVNTNGSVTFGAGDGTFTPFPLADSAQPRFAPFFADVDTRGFGSSTVKYGGGSVNGRPAFGVTWMGVGYFDSHDDRLNAFQVVIVDRSETGAGNFDVELNYDQVLWETGDASGGSKGYNGTSARAGVSLGNGSAEELVGSGAALQLEDSRPVGLIRGSQGSGGQLGRYVWTIRGGAFGV